MEALTPKEFQVVKLLEKGLQYKEIAVLHQAKIDSVKHQVKIIYSKLHARNKTEAILRARDIFHVSIN